MRVDSDHCVRDRIGLAALFRVRVKRVCPCDLIMLVAGFVLFHLNDLALKSLFAYTVFGWLFKNYLNDVLAGLAFMAYTNVLLALFRPKGRIVRFIAVVLCIFACGLFWECVAPLFVNGSVSDPWDLLAYTTGGCMYWAVNMLVDRVRV